MQQMKTRRKAYFITHEFCQNCNLAKLYARIFTIESMKLHEHYINKLSMCKTVIPIAVWRQHTPPWYHQQLRTSISQLSELSLFENKVESRKKSKKAKIHLIKKIDLKNKKLTFIDIITSSILILRP